MYRNSWLPEVFNDFLNTTNMPKANPTAPAINVLESEKDYIVELAAPGLSKEDFDVNINSDGDLTIKMEKKARRASKRLITSVVSSHIASMSRHLFCLMMFRRKVLLHVLQTVYSPLPCLRLRLKSRRLHARLQWAKRSTTP